MLEDHGYIVITYVVSICALLSFLFHLTTCLITKRAFEFRDYITYVFFFVGIYLIFPCIMYQNGLKQQNIELLKKASNMSINNYEKRLCYQAIANLSIADRNKNGKEAIQYFEKAIEKKYSQYRKNSQNLAYLYLLRGDSDKVIEIEKDINSKEISAYAYILKDNYKKALEIFPSESDAAHLYLRASLYLALGRNNQANSYRNDAQRAYTKEYKAIEDKFQKAEYAKNISGYKSIPAFKSKILRDKAEYNI